MSEGSGVEGVSTPPPHPNHAPRPHPPFAIKHRGKRKRQSLRAHTTARTQEATKRESLHTGFLLNTHTRDDVAHACASMEKSKSTILIDLMLGALGTHLCGSCCEAIAALWW